MIKLKLTIKAKTRLLRIDFQEKNMADILTKVKVVFIYFTFSLFWRREWEIPTRTAILAPFRAALVNAQNLYLYSTRYRSLGQEFQMLKTLKYNKYF